MSRQRLPGMTCRTARMPAIGTPSPPHPLLCFCHAFFLFFPSHCFSLSFSSLFSSSSGGQMRCEGGVGKDILCQKSGNATCRHQNLLKVEESKAGKPKTRPTSPSTHYSSPHLFEALLTLCTHLNTCRRRLLRFQFAQGSETGHGNMGEGSKKKQIRIKKQNSENMRKHKETITK